MFNPARWWSEKNKVKVGFKLQFHASQLTQFGGDGLIISVVPADTGKPTVKSDKATVRDGSCFWENPVYETVKFTQDPKLGKIHEGIYYFVVGTARNVAGSAKAGVVGEASIDFSSYAEATKAALVSIPLKNSKTDALLHVSIQRIQESMDQRETEEGENARWHSKDHVLMSRFGNHETNGAIRTGNTVEDAPFNNAVSYVAASNVNRQASSGSDITISSSESRSGIETSWELQMQNPEPTRDLSSLRHQEPRSDVPVPTFEGHGRSWEWLGNSAPEAITDDYSTTPRETFPRQQAEEVPDIVIEKLRSDLAALSREAEMSELELQTLRKQIVKESKRGQDLWGEIVCLKEERDALKGECEQFKALLRREDEEKTKTNLLFDAVDSRAMVEELRQELDHARELNANLRIQLQKTQESNSELILAVQDLEEMLEQKNGEFLNQSSGSLMKDIDENSREGGQLEEHSDAKEVRLLQQQISDLHREIEIYKREKDELGMQMEQLALDYEIIKHDNGDLSRMLEQSEIREKLKMQCECLSAGNAVNELESQMEDLENELKRCSKEYADSLVKKSELQDRAKNLEEELEKQRQGFEADLETLKRSKVEQEQKATRAEETLRRLQQKSANTAERLQKEFSWLSWQMTSTFEANERLTTKALAEANELQLQKSHLEDMLQKTSEDHQSIKEQYETRLHELTGQVTLMTNQIEQMQQEIQDREAQLEHQKKHAEEAQKRLSDEISMLREEIEIQIAKNGILLEDMGSKETLTCELEQMRTSIKEMELLVKQGHNEKVELENRIMLMKNEGEETREELNKMRSLLREKELKVGNLKSELDFLQTQCTELKRSQSANEPDKETLRKKVSRLTSDLKKRDDELKSMKKKTKEGTGRGTLDVVKTTSRTGKPLPRGSKEVANLKDRIKLLEGQIKLKETALETSAHTFMEKEKDLHKKIVELEGRQEVPNQSSANFCLNEVEKINVVVEDQSPCSRLSEEARNTNVNLNMTRKISNVIDRSTISTESGALSEAIKVSSNDRSNHDELRNEMALLKERNTSMEVELKEMQERYSEISLKFAVVESERQQLVMELRNLKNSNKSPEHPTDWIRP